MKIEISKGCFSTKAYINDKEIDESIQDLAFLIEDVVNATIPEHQLTHEYDQCDQCGDHNHTTTATLTDPKHIQFINMFIELLTQNAK